MRLILIAAAIAAPAWAAGAQTVQPGQWDIVTEVQSVDMPGAPAGVAAMIKGHPIRISQCLTPEQASRGPQDLMKGNKQCRFTRYSMTGGKLESEMVCQQGGGTMTATSSGSFTPTSFTVTGTSVMVNGAQRMTVVANTSGRRTGACGK